MPSMSHVPTGATFPGSRDDRSRVASPGVFFRLQLCGVTVSPPRLWRKIAVTTRLPVSILAVLAAALVAPASHAATTLAPEALACQRAIGKAGQKYKKAYLKAWQTCLDDDLSGKGCDSSEIGRAHV